MINLTKKIVILTNGSQLHLLIGQALKLIINTFINADKNFKAAISKINELYGKIDPRDTEQILLEWYAYITFQHGENHHLQIKRKEIYLATLTKTDAHKAKTILRFIYVFLHKKKAVILTLDFSRPRGSITSLPEQQSLFYSETICPFLNLERDSPHEPGSGKRAYTATQRLWQTGIRALLISSFFTPEDVNNQDLQELRVAQLKIKRNDVIPIPIVKICDTICKAFAERVSDSVKQWLSVSLTMKDSTPVQHFSGESHLIELLHKHDSPIEIVLGLVKYKRFGASSFSSNNLGDYRLDIHIHQGLEIYEKAMCVWLKAEQAYFEHQALEKEKNARLAMGKINIYIFVYLPLWRLQHPNSNFKYPDTPAKFTSSVHYDCEAPISSGRPLSLCELFRKIGYVESNGSQSEIRTFFDFLIEFCDDLEGCEKVKQPVRKVPPSKKSANVTKNVFTGEQFRQFVAYHHALNAAADYYFDESNRIGTVVQLAQGNKSFVETSDLGFVPIMYHEGKITYIKRIHPDTLTFVIHDHAPYYNPACIRFSLFLLESGVRGQTLQWLGADTYDRISHRLSRDSLQLTTLWLNTDKIHKIPVIIVTSMGNLYLLDDQRRWRNLMIKKGITGFTKEIYYDHEPTSHWGKILPLFSANPITGDPLTDKQYSTLWNYHCLNFQIWYKENTSEKNPIVGFLPLRKNPSKTHFTWEDWISGINPDDVLTLPGSPTNKIYQGSYCPVSIRAYATPHGARASFITDVSVNLPPEAVTLLTGQSVSTIIRYNKGHHLIHDRLQGAFNNRDADWYLTNPFNPPFSMSDARDRVEDSMRQGTLANTIDRLGLNSYPTSTSPREMTGVKLIATDRSLSLGACYTHICPYNFICPEQILKKFGGQKRCALCQFAVFSTHNLPAIEAHRQKLAEQYQSTIKVYEKYSANREVSTAEISRLQDEVKNGAKDVISWMLVEEVLWAQIEMQQDADQETAAKDLVVSDRSTVVQELSRYEYRADSVEGFLTRLSSACSHPESMSRGFEYKIDRATRLLMINDGDITGAAMMPSSFPNAVKLAGMIRSNLNFDKLDIEDLVRLINLEDNDWAQTMLTYRPTKSEPRSDE